MRPAFSVIFLTTWIGAGQGLFLALVAAEQAGWTSRPGVSPRLLAAGGALALLLTAAGLVASFFHLGRPERFWRTATMWRTSWLSREVIALPAFGLALAVWTWQQQQGLPGTGLTGALAVLACVALFACTSMVYASMRFLQEWATPLTVVNFTLLGIASGLTLAAALAGLMAPPLAAPAAAAALGATGLAALTRGLALRRNARLKPRSTLQTALGIRHPQIRQVSMGFMGGSFNTREFFHGRSGLTMRRVRAGFLMGAFAVPAALLALALASGSTAALLLAALVQQLGLLAERWFFLAQAEHPQNLYYQRVS